MARFRKVFITPKPKAPLSDPTMRPARANAAGGTKETQSPKMNAAGKKYFVGK